MIGFLVFTNIISIIVIVLFYRDFVQNIIDVRRLKIDLTGMFEINDFNNNGPQTLEEIFDYAKEVFYLPNNPKAILFNGVEIYSNEVKYKDAVIVKVCSAYWEYDKDLTSEDRRYTNRLLGSCCSYFEKIIRIRNGDVARKKRETIQDLRETVPLFSKEKNGHGINERSD